MKPTIKFLLLVALSWPLFLFAQTSTDHIDKLIQDIRFEEAQAAAQKILDQTDSKENIYGEALYYRGICKYNLSDLDGARQDFNQGLKLENKSSEALFWKGLAILQHENLNYDSALYFYENALNATDDTDQFYIQLLINKGFLLSAKEQYRAASELYFQAKKLYEEQKFDIPYLLQLVYGSIGDYYLIKNDYKNAERNLMFALDIAESLFDSNHPRMSELHGSLGHVYIGLENPEKILYHFEADYLISKYGKKKGSYDLIVANNVMGMSLLNVKNYQAALPYLKLAYDDMTIYFPTFDLGVHIVGMNVGITYNKLKMYDEAKKYLEESIALGVKSTGAKSQTVTEATVYLSFTYEEAGDNQKALELYTDAINAIALFKPDEPLSVYTEVVDIVTISFVLENRARLYLKMYRDEQNRKYLDLAQKDAQLNLDILHKFQETFSTESRSSLSFELGYGYYISSDIDLHLFRETNDQSYLTNILNYSERNKSDYLRTSLNLEEAKAFANIPSELLDQEKELKIRKEGLKARVITAENSGEEAIPWDSLVMIQKSIDSLADKLREYVDPSITYQEKSLTELQNQLDDNEAIMEILFQDDILINLLIAKDQVLVKRDSAKNLTDQILTFRDEIQALSEIFTTRTALTELLLSDLSKLSSNIRKLKIVRDGSLHYLPFELLGEGENYLLEKYDITYVNYLKESTDSAPSNNRLLSYAPDFTSDQLASLDPVRGDLASIPGAFEEIKSIESLFEGESVSSGLATETSFKSKAKDFGIIHMATHAIVDDANPEISRLAFNLTGDTLNDGYLHAYEIFNMEIPAHLVTLSACNTGYGKIQRGEGVMSLSRAFAFAGVPSTVVSLWPASDKSTPELMKYFYQNLKEGQTKDVALNNARKQYLATAQGKARHPFYWGGFVLIGDNSSIEDKRNLLAYLIPSILVIVMILTVYRRKQKSNQS
ncbi:MAG: CHAT domain-containing protein [Ekhidna sp.]